MYLAILNLAFNSVFLFSFTSLTFILVLVSIVFIFLIALAVIKNYKLKADNERLSKINPFDDKENKGYKDFTKSHIYDSNTKN